MSQKPGRRKRKSSGGLRVPADEVPRTAPPASVDDEAGDTMPMPAMQMSDEAGGSHAAMNATAGEDDDRSATVIDDRGEVLPEIVEPEELAAKTAELNDDADSSSGDEEILLTEEDDAVDEIPIDEEEPQEAPGGDAEKQPVTAEGRANTVALSDDDLEELREEFNAPASAEDSGEIVTEDEIEEVAPPKPPPAPPQKQTLSMLPKQWFETVFADDYLRTLPYLTPQVTKREADFVLESLDVEPGAQLLDLACGYGRHAMELVARGYHVVGLDLSLPLLLRGGDEARRRGLDIQFVHSDMREIAFKNQFDGGYCLFFSFGYFEDDINKLCLERLFRAMKPGAKFVLQVLNRDYILADLPSRVWWEGDACVVLEEIEFNYFSSRVVSNRSIVFEDGTQKEYEISIRIFSLHELGQLLHEVGFRITDISGTMLTPGRFLGNQSREIIVTVERPKPEKSDT